MKPSNEYILLLFLISLVIVLMLELGCDSIIVLCAAVATPLLYCTIKVVIEMCTSIYSLKGAKNKE